MKKSTIFANFALAGLAAGALMGCGEDAPAAHDHSGHDHDHDGSHHHEHKVEHMEVHGCAGLNVCKGLGGCKVTAEKLQKLSEKMGIPADKAGAPHDCAGHNACKGLGGCKVTAEKFLKLKAKLDKAG